MAQEFNGFLAEDAFVRVDDESVFGEAGEERAEVRLVLFRRGAGNEDVVEVDEDKRESVADSIHEALESLASVLESKGHAEKLEEAKRRDDCSLGYVVRSHGDLVVAPNQVNLGEDSLACQVLGKVLDVRERVPVWDGCVVNPSVIAAGAEFAIVLDDHLEWGGPWAVRTSDDAHPFHGGEFCLGGLQFLRRQTTSPGIDRRATGDDVVSHTMFDCLTVKPGFRDGREFAEDLAEALSRRRCSDAVDGRDAAIAFDGEREERLDVDQATVGHINHEVKMAKEVGPNDGLGDLCDGECPPVLVLLQVEV